MHIAFTKEKKKRNAYRVVFKYFISVALLRSCWYESHIVVEKPAGSNEVAEHVTRKYSSVSVINLLWSALSEKRGSHAIRHIRHQSNGHHVVTDTEDTVSLSSCWRQALTQNWQVQGQVHRSEHSGRSHVCKNLTELPAFTSHVSLCHQCLI